MKKAQIDDPFYFLLAVFLVAIVLFAVFSSYKAKKDNAVGDSFDLDSSALKILSLKYSFEPKVVSKTRLILTDALKDYYERELFSKCDDSITNRKSITDDFENCISEKNDLNDFLIEKLLEGLKGINYSYGVIAPFDNVDIDTVSGVVKISSSKKSLFYYPKHYSNIFSERYFLDDSLKDNAPYLLTNINVVVPLPKTYYDILEFSSNLKDNKNSEYMNFKEKLFVAEDLFCKDEKDKLKNVFEDIKGILNNCNKQKDCYCGSYTFKNLDEYYDKAISLYFYPDNNDLDFAISDVKSVNTPDAVFCSLNDKKPDFDSALYYSIIKNLNLKLSISIDEIKKYIVKDSFSNRAIKDFESGKIKGSDAKCTPLLKDFTLYFYNDNGKVVVKNKFDDSFKSCSFENKVSSKKINIFLNKNFNSFTDDFDNVNFYSFNPERNYDKNSFNIAFLLSSEKDYLISVVSDNENLGKYLDAYFETSFDSSAKDFGFEKISKFIKDESDRNVVFVYVPNEESFFENYKKTAESKCSSESLGFEEYNSCVSSLTDENTVKKIYADFVKSVIRSSVVALKKFDVKKRVVVSRDVCVDKPLNILFYNNERKIFGEQSYDFFNIYPHVSLQKNRVWPFSVDRITQCYGPPPFEAQKSLGYDFHAGIDLIPQPIEDLTGSVYDPYYTVPVKNVFSGIVLYKNDGTLNFVNQKFKNPFGESLVVYDPYSKIAVLYGHLKSESIPEDIKIGENIVAGKEIGFVGSTGNSNGAHLHLEFFKLDENEADTLLDCSKKGFSNNVCGAENFREWYNKKIYSNRFSKTVNPLCILDSKVPVFPLGEKDFLKTKLPEKISDVIVDSPTGKSIVSSNLDPGSWSYNCIADYYGAYYDISFGKKSYYTCENT